MGLVGGRERGREGRGGGKHWDESVLLALADHPSSPTHATVFSVITESSLQDHFLKTTFLRSRDFCGRFKVGASRTPEHISKTCVVFRAVDTADGDREVVLKLMRQENDYRREVSE